MDILSISNPGFKFHKDSGQKSIARTNDEGNSNICPIPFSTFESMLFRNSFSQEVAYVTVPCSVTVPKKKLTWHLNIHHKWRCTSYTENGWFFSIANHVSSVPCRVTVCGSVSRGWKAMAFVARVFSSPCKRVWSLCRAPRATNVMTAVRLGVGGDRGIMGISMGIWRCLLGPSRNKALVRPN